MNTKKKNTRLNYFCECTNKRINVIQDILEYRKHDPLNVQAKVNLAMQIMMFKQEPILAAYELIYDLLGLEAQNVKALMNQVSIQFDLFQFLGVEKQCNLLIDIANNYQIHEIAVRLFFDQPFHECMLRTQYIKRQNIRHLCLSHLYYLTMNSDFENCEIFELLKFTRKFDFDVEIKINDNIRYFISKEFNKLAQSPIHDEAFKKFSKRKTLQLINKKDYQPIDETLINTITVEIQLYLWATKKIQLDYLQSAMIVKFNMLILKLLYKFDSQIDLRFSSTLFDDDPQQLLSYIIQVIAALVPLGLSQIIHKILIVIKNLKFTKIVNDEFLQCSINALLKQKPDSQILQFFETLFKPTNMDIYQKIAIFNNSDMDYTLLPRKQAIHNLVTSLMIKQDQEYLVQNIDKLYVWMCHGKYPFIFLASCKNQPRAVCNFLEVIYILQYKYDQKFLKRKLTEYFSFSHEDLNSTLMIIYQQIEAEVSQEESVTFEYIAVIAKMLHLLLLINQNPKNRGFFMEYFQKQMLIINNFKQKLPQNNEISCPHQQIAHLLEFKNPKKKKALLLNLSLIERFFRLNRIDCRQLQILKLQILSKTSDVPDYLLLQLSNNQKEYDELRKVFKEPKVIKELNFLCKLERYNKKIGAQQIKIKSREPINNLNQFIKHAEKLLLQKQLPTINQIQILEQLFHQLTSSMFDISEKPKFYTDLFQQSEIEIFKFEHNDYVSFFLGNGQLCSSALFYNVRAEAMQLFLKVSYKMVKVFNRLGFYKAISMTMDNLALFSQRVLAITTLVNMYSRTPWLENLPFQQITDGVCNVVQSLNKKRNYGSEVCETTRQSLYRQRKSCIMNLRESYRKLTQNFDSENILNGKFKRVYFKFTLEYLIVQNHSQAYVYDKLLIKRKDQIDLRNIHCQILIQLLKCTEPQNYNCFVNDCCNHEFRVAEIVINQTVPTYVLGLCELELCQKSCNYGYQFLHLIQNQLVKSIHNDIEQSKLYMYLFLRLKEYLGDSKPQYDHEIRCKCPKIQSFEPSSYEFDMIANMATFQMNQKRILTQQDDLSIWNHESIQKDFSLTSIHDLKVQRDIVVINLFEYNGEKIILISKYCHKTKSCINKQINSIEKCLQFKDALIYYLVLVQENMDCLSERYSIPNKWWKTRTHYEQELLKKQSYIEVALSEHMEFIYSSENPLLILSPQLQLLPWDHMGNVVFSRVLSLGHIFDLTNKPTNPKQGLFYVLNPGCDLDKSEKRLLPLLRSFNLKGLSRQKPQESQIVECLQKNEYLLYIGHGGGEQYINQKQVLKTEKHLNGRPYLLGCSSAQMIELTRFKGTNVSIQEIYLNHVDWHGLAVSYLLKGCPSLFGALWPITDRDADKYAKDLINQYGKNSEMNPMEVIIETKPKCHLKVLNGTAFVLYGIHEEK